jgi:hypothetical protein
MEGNLITGNVEPEKYSDGKIITYGFLSFRFPSSKMWILVDPTLAGPLQNLDVLQ